MNFHCNGVNKATAGYWNNIAFVCNEVATGGSSRIGVTDAGNPEFWVSGTSNKYAIHTSRDGAKFGGSIEIFSNGSGWNEGVRMHLSSNNWCGVVMCGSDNTGSSGTSAKTWSMHNNDGSFYITKNGSNMGNTSYYIANTNGSTWQFGSNITAAGAVTALSDARHKKVLSNVPMTVEQIAQMPSVLFRWTDGTHDDKVYAGTLAQNWQSVLPQAIVRQDNEEGTLAFNYGVAALISAIVTARKVVDHERRIAELERENKILKERLKVA